MECVWVNLIILNCYSPATERRAAVGRWFSYWKGLTPPSCALTWTAVNNGSQAALTAKGQSHRRPWWKMVHLAAHKMAPTCIQDIHPSLFICIYLLRVTLPWSLSPRSPPERQEIFRKLRHFLFQLDLRDFSYWVKKKDKKQQWHGTNFTRDSSEGWNVVLNLSRNKWLSNRWKIAVEHC